MNYAEPRRINEIANQNSTSNQRVGSSSLSGRASLLRQNCGLLKIFEIFAFGWNFRILEASLTRRASRVYKNQIHTTSFWTQLSMVHIQVRASGCIESIAQRAGWVGASGAPSGKKTSSQCGDGHDDQCGTERQWVARAHSVQKISQQAR